MVIDAAPEMLDLFQELLQDEGYEVFPYTYDIGDLREVEHIHPDLIILDYG
jgi:DNA-binding response OmpR family regulator